ncbi:hypothetical protein, partial [Geomicrobium sp. JCM 19039]|uniref:hypothetical protein n=1 Tax=Geomicrobium sp. JCM 19039 TaxID=1460636 RepID=UPI001EE685DB
MVKVRPPCFLCTPEHKDNIGGQKTATVFTRATRFTFLPTGYGVERCPNAPYIHLSDTWERKIIIFNVDVHINGVNGHKLRS